MECLPGFFSSTWLTCNFVTRSEKMSDQAIKKIWRSDKFARQTHRWNNLTKYMADNFRKLHTSDVWQQFQKWGPGGWSALKADHLGCRPSGMQTTLSRDHLGCTPPWVQTTLGADHLGADQLGGRTHCVQTTLGADNIGCRPPWEQTTLGADHLGITPHWL